MTMREFFPAARLLTRKVRETVVKILRSSESRAPDAKVAALGGSERTIMP